MMGNGYARKKVWKKFIPHHFIHSNPGSVQSGEKLFATPVSSLAPTTHHIQITRRRQENLRVGVFRHPLAQFHLGRFGGEFELLTFIRPGDGVKGAFLQRIPNGAGITIVQDENIVEGVSGRAEFDGFLFVDLAVANCSQLGERSPTHGKRRSLEVVVDDFMTIENHDGVCFRHPVVFETDDDRIVIDSCLRKPGIADPGEFGFVD